MDTKPRITLCEIVTKYGASICEDPKRCEGLLWEAKGIAEEYGGRNDPEP